MSVAVNFMATRGQSQPTFPSILKRGPLGGTGNGVGGAGAYARLTFLVSGVQAPVLPPLLCLSSSSQVRGEKSLENLKKRVTVISCKHLSVYDTYLSAFYKKGL